MANEQIRRFYVTRINKQTGEITYINFDRRYNELFSARATIDDVVGYENSADANAIISRLNGISEHFDGKFEYYYTRRDENTFPAIDRLSDEAKRWFEDAPEEEEAPTEEPAE